MVKTKSYMPTKLNDALKILKEENPVPYCGGTDLMIEAANVPYLFINKVEELKKIRYVGNNIHIGSAVTFTQLIESELIPDILKSAAKEIAAPAIRNMGSVGGNIGNGSAKADSALIFFATDSSLVLKSCDGERTVKIKDFYLGRKKLDLRQGELITEIIMPRYGLNNYYYKKVGARNALAISRVSFAGIMDSSNGKILNLATAFGAVSDIIIRREDIDAILIGKTIDEAKKVKADYLAKFDEAIVPIRGRISAEYRKCVCMNLLKDFLESNGI